MCPLTGKARHESFLQAGHTLMNANMFANIMKIVFPTEHCEIIWIKYLPSDMSLCRWSQWDLCFICGLEATVQDGHVLYEYWLWQPLTRWHLPRLLLVLKLCIWILEAKTLALRESHVSKWASLTRGWNSIPEFQIFYHCRTETDTRKGIQWKWLEHRTPTNWKMVAFQL